MPTLPQVFAQGLLADRPAASPDNQGFLYFAVDQDAGAGRLTQSNGTTWMQIATNLDGSTHTTVVPNARGPHDPGAAYAVGDVVTTADDVEYLCIQALNAPVSDYPAVVLADTPVAYWPLTEAITEAFPTFADATEGGAHDVTSQLSAVRTVPGPVAGTTAVAFDQINPQGGYNYADSLITTNTTGMPLDNDSWTVEVWMNLSLYTPYSIVYSSEQSMIPTSYGQLSSTNPVLGFYTYDNYGNSPDQQGLDGYIWGPLNTDSGHYFEIDPYVLDDGGWHHVVMVADATGSLLTYVDGTLIGTYSTSADRFNGLAAHDDNVIVVGETGFMPDSPNTITPYGFYPFIGALGHVAWYNGLLSAERVKAHYAYVRAVGNLAPQDDTAHWVTYSAGGFTYRGIWDRVRSYGRGDLVLFNNQNLSVSDETTSQDADTFYLNVTPTERQDTGIYRDLVLADAPRAYWPLEGQDYTDVAQNGYDLIPFNDALTTVTGLFPGTTAPKLGTFEQTAPGWNDGEFSGALWTDETAGLVPDNGAFALEVWFVTPPDYEGQQVMSLGAPNENTPFISLYINAESSGMLDPFTYVVASSSGSISVARNFDVFVQDGKWHHLVYSDDGTGTGTLYLDGVLYSHNHGGTSGYTNDVGNVFFLGTPGADAGGSNFPASGGGNAWQQCVMTVAHAAVYDHALTDAQVYKHYNAVAHLAPDVDQVHWLPFANVPLHILGY